MDAEKTSALLENARDNAPEELQHYFLSFEDYWERKLWHELTDLLVRFYHEEKSKPARIELFEGFVKGFGEKINQLKLVLIGLQAAGQCKGAHISLWRFWGCLSGC